MRIAIPTQYGRLNTHFGHSREFTLIDVNPLTNDLIYEEIVEAPPHKPGLLPKWLKSLGANIIITGGMGDRAIHLFKKQGIDVILGVKENDIKIIANNYLNNSLESGVNACDH